MKFLCICQYGHCRSVCLARCLQSAGHPAVAIGWATNGGAIDLLAPWSDRIFVLQRGIVQYVPEQFRDKVAIMDVGPDRWMNPFHPELREILNGMRDEYFAKEGIESLPAL